MGFLSSVWVLRIAGMLVGALILYFILQHLFNYVIKSFELKRGKPIANLSSVKHFTKRLYGLVVCVSFLLIIQNILLTYGWLIRLTTILLIVQMIYVLHSLGVLINEVYSTYDIAKTRPITSIIQVIEVLLWVLGGIWIVSIITQQDPGTLMVSVSALFAALSFVFRDMIVNFVSGLQLTSTDMLKIGDRVVLDENLDGTVESITMNSVRIKNADQTTTILPAAKLMNEPFKNYRNTVDRSIRRFKRTFIIDIKTVQPATSDLLVFLKKDQQNKELLHHSNLYLYYLYVEHRLQQHPEISQHQSRLVQIKDPTPQGIPLDIIAFTTLSDYETHEFVVRELMDSLLLKLNDFHLEIYQRPSSFDIRED